MSSSASSAASRANPTTVERDQTAPALLAVAIVIAGSTLVELGVRLAVTHASNGVRVWSILHGGWALLPVCALAAFASRDLGAKSLAVSFGAFATLWASYLRFRGLWIWPGTFDDYWDPQVGWLLPAAIGFAIGSLGLFLPTPRRNHPSWIVCGSFALIVVAAIVEFVGGRLFAESIHSAYPETRHVVILGIGLVLVTGLFAASREAR